MVLCEASMTRGAKIDSICSELLFAQSEAWLERKLTAVASSV